MFLNNDIKRISESSNNNKEKEAKSAGLTIDEARQLIAVMKKAHEFEISEEKHLMRQPLEGQLYKYTNVVKGWQFRWFVLNPDQGKLEYFEKEEHKKSLKPSRGLLMLAGAVICPSDEDSQTFTVNAANGEVYRLKALDAKERQHWVNRLRATAEYHLDYIQISKYDSTNNSYIHNSMSLSSHMSSGAAFNTSSLTAGNSFPLPNFNLERTNAILFSPTDGGYYQSNQTERNHPNIQQQQQHHHNNYNNSPGVGYLSGKSVAASPFEGLISGMAFVGGPGVFKSHNKLSQAMGLCVGLNPGLDGNDRSYVASSLRNCFNQLTALQEHNSLLYSKIENLPRTGTCTPLDKDMLLLKASSNAVLNCLQHCLLILQYQASQVPVSRISKNTREELSISFENSLKTSLIARSQLDKEANERCSMNDGVLESEVMDGGLTSNLRGSIPNKTIGGSMEINFKAADARKMVLRSKYNNSVQDEHFYRDVDLGTIDEHKPVILHLLSQLKLGMDLTKVVLPTFILERRSLLEMFADSMAHPHLFLKISDQLTPVTRLLSVVEWYLTSFHSIRQVSTAKKPYNPIIGETFHCSWKLSTTAPLTEGPNNNTVNHNSNKSAISSPPDNAGNFYKMSNNFNLNNSSNNNNNNNDMSNDNNRFNISNNNNNNNKGDSNSANNNNVVSNNQQNMLNNVNKSNASSTSTFFSEGSNSNVSSNNNNNNINNSNGANKNNNNNKVAFAKSILDKIEVAAMADNNSPEHASIVSGANPSPAANNDNNNNNNSNKNNGIINNKNCNNDEGNLPTTLYYCAEQVSHHPPVSAFYFESPEKQTTMEASIWTKSKFMGMSIGVAMIGKVHLKLLKHGEEYEFTLPSAYARSILTVPWVELGDKVNVTCEKTGYSAGIVFHTKPFYGGKLHKVTAEVKNPNNEFICHVTGELNGVLEFNQSNGQNRSFDTNKLKTELKYVRPIPYQSVEESRSLWNDVTECLKVGDINRATHFKHLLEEEQRKDESRRAEANIPFSTQFFDKSAEANVWKFKYPLKYTPHSNVDIIPTPVTSPPTSSSVVVPPATAATTVDCLSVFVDENY